MDFIGIVGGRNITQEVEQLAYETGRLIAQAGYGLVCGGMGGVMEAAARGAKQEGGLTLAIIPQDDPSYANPYMDIVIPTGLGLARNVLIVLTARGLIAINGSYGTLSEIAYAFQHNKPIVGLRTWQIPAEMEQAQTPQLAVQRIVELINHGK